VNRPLPRIRRSPIVLVALTILLAFPLGVLASHTFGDVPNSNPFHNDIDAIAEAGVTTGCGGGNYCPKANVTREQMAAFMNRLGALGPGTDPVVNAKTSESTDNYSLGCPTNTVWSQGLCFETTSRNAQIVYAASETCAGLSGFLGAGPRWRLPTLLQLRAARGLNGINIDAAGELTDSLYMQWNGSANAVHTWSAFDNGTFQSIGAGTSRKFRCVATPIRNDGIINLLSDQPAPEYPEMTLGTDGLPLP